MSQSFSSEGLQSHFQSLFEMASDFQFYYGFCINLFNQRDNKLADNPSKTPIKSNGFLTLTSKIPFFDSYPACVSIPAYNYIAKYTKKNL